MLIVPNVSAAAAMRPPVGPVSPAGNPIAAPAARAVPSAQPAGPVAPGDAERVLIERMSAPKTLEHIRVLSTEPRVWKSPGHAKAVDYVTAQLQAAGWDVKVADHKSGGFGGGTLRNVVAERKGTAPDGERKLVIAGAHLDSVNLAPGANDDGSGSATLIELANNLKGIDTRNDIRFVWFDGEEAGLLGSRAYVADNPADMPRTIAMLNMDMVGSPFGDIGVGLGANTPIGMAQAMNGILARTGLQGAVRSERHTRSDHASFDRVGVPAFDFGVAVKTLAHDDPNYHSPRDTIDKINSQVLEGYGDLIGATVLDFANRAERIVGPPGLAPGEEVLHGPPI